MRRRWRSRWPSRSPGAVDTVDAGDLPASCRDGSWGHTQAHHAVLTGTRCTRPTSTPTFPHQQAERSPHNQHVLSFNPDHPVQETRPTNAGRRQQKTGARKPSTGISVELGGFEPPTSSMPWKRATNCAIAPYLLRRRGDLINNSGRFERKANAHQVPLITCTTRATRTAQGRRPPTRPRCPPEIRCCARRAAIRNEQHSWHSTLPRGQAPTSGSYPPRATR